MNLQDPKVLAQMIDHTLLKPEATVSELEKLCLEAREFKFKTVCVERKWISKACELLKGSDVLPITVVGFPSGTELTEQKAKETKEAIELGAKEIDMVINYPRLKEQDYVYVQQDIQSVVATAKGAPVKVILEISELNELEIVTACALSKAAGAAFVKTSTGFSKSGATKQGISLMRTVVGEGFGVKASGGVRDYDTAMAMIEAGANRLGMSASVAVIEEAQRRVSG